MTVSNPKRVGGVFDNVTTGAYILHMTTGHQNQITINPKVRFGKPCIRGTRIAVVDILNLLAAGYSVNDIPAQYPGITKKDVAAAIEFATNLTER